MEQRQVAPAREHKPGDFLKVGAEGLCYASTLPGKAGNRLR
jgi:hypothetical protein